MYKVIRWLRKNYYKSIHSIGFYPTLITLLCLAFFVVLYRFEGSSEANNLKQRFIWLNLRHAEAARTIVSTISTGIIGLTVFSFSMVMVVMSQAASQMSNRVLDNLIGNKFQQLTLGFYIGTIVVSFFLLSVIDDKGVEGVPSITVFVLMAFTIIDLFLFVSFLHYITQSVRYENLIKRIHNKTIRSLINFASKEQSETWSINHSESYDAVSRFSGYFQGINRLQLLKFAAKKDIQIEFFPLKGTYILKGEPLFKIYFSKALNETEMKELLENIDFYNGQQIDKNPFYGFLHLSEVAVKALSPGINDPNTAVLSIHALTDLFYQKMNLKASSCLNDANGNQRIFLRERSFEEVFEYCMYPIWDYGKKDRFVQHAMQQMLHQLEYADKDKKHCAVLETFRKSMQSSQIDPLVK